VSSCSDAQHQTAALPILASIPRGSQTPTDCHERFADHAVKVADQLIFLVAGEE